jgi:toxin ParE1/3/4
LNLQVLSVAEVEAANAALWYEEQREGLGGEFLDELRHSLERIRTAPASFSPLEYYSGPHETRRCLFRRFPYLVVFVCRPDQVLVVAVSHVRQRPLYWLQRLA